MDEGLSAVRAAGTAATAAARRRNGCDLPPSSAFLFSQAGAGLTSEVIFMQAGSRASFPTAHREAKPAGFN